MPIMIALTRSEDGVKRWINANLIEEIWEKDGKTMIAIKTYNSSLEIQETPEEVIGLIGKAINNIGYWWRIE